MKSRALRASIGVSLAAPLFLAAAQHADKPAIGDIATEFREGRLFVAFRLENCLPEETVERIHSGIPVTFRHKLELLGPRSFPLATRRTEARTIVESRVEYDALIKRYTLERTVQIRSKATKQAPEPSRVQRVTASELEMRVFMTEIGVVPLYDPSRGRPAGRLKLKISSSIGRHYVMMIFPGHLTVSAERILEIDGSR